MANILVIGDAILDHYVYGAINRQSPEDNSIPIVDIESEEYRLGGCMNVAANIRSISNPYLGYDKVQPFYVSLSSIYSRFTGRKLFDKMIQCDDSCLVEENRAGSLAPSSAEIIKTRVIDQATGKQLLRIDNRKKFSDLNIEFYKESSGEISDKFDAVVVSDYQKGLVNDYILEKLKDFKGPVFVDSKNPDLARWDELEECIIKVNLKEWNHRQNESKHFLIVTYGSRGAELCKPHPIKYFFTKPIESPDVIGAGDVFLAGLVVNYMRHRDLPFAIEFANMCAGISVKQQGTTEVRL